MSHSGGIQADLYRTIDGGLSYEEISLPTIEVPLVENQVLYQSEDHGKTWAFVKEK